MVGLLYSIAIIILKFIPEYNSTAKIQFYSLISSIIGAVVLLSITLDTKFIQSYRDLLMLISSNNFRIFLLYLSLLNLVFG